jgi:hypothetical protein
MTAPVRLNSRDNHTAPRFISRTEATVSTLILIALTAIAVIGWANRDNLPFTPDRGVGYWMGIVGASMMLLLIIYPLRKRVASMRWIGSVGLWFRLHMLLGLVGPLIVLFHARFDYSATNTGVALISMLVVMAAGLIGWLFYRHIYRGYELRRLEARELLEEMVASRAALDADGDAGDEVRLELEGLEREASRVRSGLLPGVVSLIRINWRTRIGSFALERRLRSHIGDSAPTAGWGEDELKRHQRDATRHFAAFLRAVREATGFAVYDRLVRLWHYFHLPLFYFMIVAVIAHVIAVHMY